MIRFTEDIWKEFILEFNEVNFIIMKLICFLQHLYYDVTKVSIEKNRKSLSNENWNWQLIGI